MFTVWSNIWRMRMILAANAFSDRSSALCFTSFSVKMLSSVKIIAKMMATKSTMMVLSRVANDLRMLNTDTMEMIVKR